MSISQMGNIRAELELAREFGFYDEYVRCVRFAYGIYAVFLIVLFTYMYIFGN